jgi:hypothetical protein
MPLRRSGLTLVGLLGVVAIAGSQGRPGAKGVPGVRNWNRRPPGAGDYQIVTEVSGRAEVVRFLEIPPPGADLSRICAALKEAEASAVSATQGYLAELEASPHRDFRPKFCRENGVYAIASLSLILTS